MSGAPAGASVSAGPTPDVQAAFDAFSRQAFADGTLSARMKQVVAVAVAMHADSSTMHFTPLLATIGK